MLLPCLYQWAGWGGKQAVGGGGGGGEVWNDSVLCPKVSTTTLHVPSNLPPPALSVVRVIRT